MPLPSVPGVPPYTPLLHAPETSNYAVLTDDAFYLDAALKSLAVAGISTLFCLLIGYPMALAIARAPDRWRSLLLLGVMLPFWTGFLLRVTAWIGLLRDGGWVDLALTSLGLPAARLLYTNAAMYIGVTYAYLPFMILPLLAVLAERDRRLEEASLNLGASRTVTFFRVIVPMSAPAIIAGLALVLLSLVRCLLLPPQLTIGCQCR